MKKVKNNMFNTKEKEEFKKLWPKLWTCQQLLGVGECTKNVDKFIEDNYISLSELAKVIDGMRTEFPEYESDSYDSGCKDTLITLREKLFK